MAFEFLRLFAIPNMSNFWFSMSVVIGCFFFFATTVCTFHQKKENDVWIESRQGLYNAEFEYFFSGPFIYRRTNHPGFVYQKSTCGPLKIQDLIPFLVVIDCSDSMTALTDFDIRLNGFEVLTSGRIRFSTGHVVGMSYFLDVDGWEKGSEFNEAICFSFDEKVLEFEVNNGRVFHVFTKVDAKGDTTIVVEQKNVPLPATKDILRLQALTMSEFEKYNLWFSWWQQHLARNRPHEQKTKREMATSPRDDTKR